MKTEDKILKSLSEKAYKIRNQLKHCKANVLVPNKNQVIEIGDIKFDYSRQYQYS